MSNNSLYTLSEAKAKVARESACHVRRESVRNIGTMPIIGNIGRRLAGKESLVAFGLSYFGEGLWELSEDHLRFLLRLELLIRKGGRTVYVLPRGFGKSLWSRIAVLWAITYGYRLFCPLISANGTHADNNYVGVKCLLETPLFVADFPEIAFPITCLEGITHRCSGQTYTTQLDDVQSTNIEYSANRIVLPSTEGAFDSLGVFHLNAARNSVIVSQGLFAAIRGISVVRWDGVVLRPDFCICDDPQDEESAVSPTQTAKRMRVIKNSLIGSGGHDNPLAVGMAATIMAEGDLIEQLLADPAWTGERVAFFKNEPTHKDVMWLTQYRKIRQDYDRNDPESMYLARDIATQFYADNRAEMDAGAEVSWPACFSTIEGEISAVQHGMNLLIDHGEEYFNSEVQNKPRREVIGDNLTPANLLAATNKLKHKTVPGWATKVTAAIDVHANILYYTVVAWDELNFTGQVIDYGTHPRQVVDVFRQNAVKYGLAEAYPALGEEAAIRKGLDVLMAQLAKNRYKSQDGSNRQIDRALVDSGYKPEVVFRAVMEGDTRLFVPSRGEFYGAKGQEFNSVTRKRKNQNKSDIVTYGDGWRSCKLSKYQDLQRVFYDANAWKSFIRARLLTPDGAEGTLRFFKYRDGHDMLYDHILAEKSTEVEARGRKVVEWDNPLRHDNHLWDCLVYCAIAGSMVGCVVQGTQAVITGKATRERKRIGY